MRTEQQKQDAFLATAAFPRKPEAIQPARDWASTVYRQAGGRQPDICRLLVSELATNALEYTDAERFQVTVRASPLSVEVVDGSTKEPVLRGPRNDEDEHGRGLMLVEALAARFEVFVGEDHKVCRFWLDEE